MTPTEQDKKIIRGIEKALEKSFSYQVLVLNKECRDELIQLITADRKRVALEEEWKKVDYSNDAMLPKVGEPVLCHITYDGKHDATYAVLIRVDEDDCSWRTADDNSEISYWVNVTHWKKFTTLKAQ